MTLLDKYRNQEFTTLTYTDYMIRNNNRITRKKNRIAISAGLRLRMIQQVENCCERCNNYYDCKILEIHHIDGDPSNDDVGNMMVCCANCHKELRL